MKSYLELCDYLKTRATCADFVLQHLSIDSRGVNGQDVFCAYHGERFDGHAFIDIAITRGAQLILAEHELDHQVNIPVLIIPDLKHKLAKLAAWFYDQPSSHLKIIGVTGTNGKTSTAHYLAQFLHLLGHKVAVLGTVGNGIWGMLRVSELTTSDAVNLQRQLHEFVLQKVEYVCMEVSSHALALGRINELQFISAAFTNLSQDHLDFHADMQSYAETKARLFSWPSLKSAIINQDDVYARLMTQRTLVTTQVFYYSLRDHHEPIVFADRIQIAAQGLSFELHSIFGQASIKTPLLGEFNVSNILAALTTLLSLDFNLADLARVSILLQPVKGRMEVLRYPNLPMVVIDYAHTPDALEKAIACLRVYQKPLWVLFGCGGDRDTRKRPLMAQAVEKFADQTIVTEDNSRTENPEKIFADISAGFTHTAKVKFIPLRQDAIIYVLTHAPRDAIILLAGKGHETYLDKQGQKIHFDEREIVKNFAMK